MANVNAPFGARPVKHLNGSNWNQQATLYFIPSTDTNAFYIGDWVVSAAGGDAGTGTPACTLALNTNRATNFTTGNIRGVIVGVATAVATPGGTFVGGFDPDNLNTLSIPATKTKNYYVYVVDDTSVVFEMQANGTLATSTYNNNIGFLPTAPTGIVQISAGVLAASTANTTQALPLKLLGGRNAPDTDLTLTNAIWYVVMNQSELGNNTVGV